MAHTLWLRTDLSRSILHLPTGETPLWHVAAFHLLRAWWRSRFPSPSKHSSKHGHGSPGPHGGSPGGQYHPLVEDIETGRSGGKGTTRSTTRSGGIETGRSGGTSRGRALVTAAASPKMNVNGGVDGEEASARRRRRLARFSKSSDGSDGASFKRPGVVHSSGDESDSDSELEDEEASGGFNLAELKKELLLLTVKVEQLEVKVTSHAHENILMPNPLAAIGFPHCESSVRAMIPLTDPPVAWSSSKEPGTMPPTLTRSHSHSQPILGGRCRCDLSPRRHLKRLWSCAGGSRSCKPRGRRSRHWLIAQTPAAR